jgi:hypothetical protein
VDGAEDAGVVLADLALRAGQVVLHGLAPGGPGIEEVVRACRTGWLAPAELRARTLAAPGRPYRLLPGLRHPWHWTAIGPVAFDAALDGLRRTFSVVVADVSGDLEGEAETGSADVEDRNHMARRTIAEASAVVVVGGDGPTGRQALDATVEAVRRHGQDADRVVPVLNRPVATPDAGRVAVDEARRAGRAVRLGPLGDDADLAGWARPVIEVVASILDRRGRRPSTAAEPTRVAPGSIGHWTAWTDGTPAW